MKRKVMVLVGIMTVLIVMLLCCGTAGAESGTFNGMDWDLTDGVLTLGKDGETQILDNTHSYIQRTSWPWWNKTSRITSVIMYDVEAHGSLLKMFDTCSQATSIDVSKLDTTYVTDIRDMFYGCSKVSTLDVSGWNTSSLQEMLGVFGGCSSLAEIVGISDWNTSSVKNSIIPDRRPNSVFYGCEQLTSLDLSRWDTSQMQNFVFMFQECRNLTSLNISGWNTSSAVDFTQMFYCCPKLSNIDVSSFVTSNVTNMKGMFGECASLSEVDVSGFDTSHVTNMGSMFKGCASLTSLNLSNFVTDNVESFADMFYGCSNITSLDDVSDWNTSHVTLFGGMFHDCSSLTSLDVTNFDTSQSTSFEYMFSGCAKLQSLDVSQFDTNKVTTMAHMFGGCSLITELDVSEFDMSHVRNMNEMFFECSNLVTIDVSEWDTSSVISFTRIFYRCSALENLDVSHWDVSHCTSGFGVFSWCSSVGELDVSHWNVSNFGSTELMFAGCSLVESLDVSNWDIHNVQTFRQMFTSCSKLKGVDVSHWDVSNATDLGWIFSSCSDLEMLDLSNWDPRNVTTYYGPFQACSNLRTVVLGDISPFVGKTGSVSAVLPTPPSNKDGVEYTGKWIREDGTFGPYTPGELKDNYTSAMAGKWVWEKVPTEYSITFVCNEDGYLGEMPPVTVEASEDYELPGNAFRVFGSEFEYWTDGTRRTWEDKAVIPANTYAVNAQVTLTAVFAPRDRSIDMQDGTFDFSIKGNEKALFQPIPASTSYQVYEQTPFGWNLIKQSNNTGEIMPDEESEALFLNKYDPLKVTIRFAGTKLMDESAADPDSFNFLLYEDETLIDIASVSDGGAIEFQPIEYDAAGDHHYYIKEVIGSDNTVEYDTHVEEITVSITSDGVGYLSADVMMDEDQILFENKSKPGMLALRKLNATTEDRDGVFYYEVQFSAENGQPYDLLSSDISYEEREGNVSDFPETQPLPEKPKYTLTVEHIAVGANLAETVKQSVEYQYCAGDVVTINGADTSRWTSGQLYYVPSEVDSIAVRVSDGVYKFIMPAQNLTVQLKYDLYQSLGMKVYWTGVDYLRPDLTVDVFADGDYIASVITHEDDPALSSSDTVYTGVRYYDDNGQVIEYTTALSAVPEDYYLEQQTMLYGIWRFYMHAGYRAYVIWDDFDNAYGTRPSSMNVTYTNCAGTSWQSFVSEPLWRKDLESDGANYRDHDFDLQITNIPVGYEIVAPTEGDEVGKYDKKLKLVARSVSGSIVWDDNNDANGVRPENVTVKLMNGETVVSTQNASIVSEWQFSFTNLPVTDENGLIDYTVWVDDVAGYTKSVDGTTIMMTKIPTVEIPVTDVTLLSASEYNTYRSQIPAISAYWWLRGPGSWWSPSMYVPSNVMPDGSVEIFYASNGNFGIRPVLVCDLNGIGLEIGNKLQFAGYDWTVISDSLVLCDSCVGNSPFGPGNTWVKSQSETLTTPYDDSYAKTWVENWATEKGIMPEPEFEITEVTLLSKNEYETYREDIAFDMAQWWWLRSPGSSSMYANFVRSDTGNVGNYAHSVSTDYFGVRPALICDLTDVGYSVGDKVSGSGYEWTVISNSISVTDDPYNGYGLILCDETVGQTAFRSDNTASDANVYDASDVKQWLANWAAAHPFWSKTVTATVIQ